MRGSARYVLWIGVAGCVRCESAELKGARMSIASGDYAAARTALVAELTGAKPSTAAGDLVMFLDLADSDQGLAHTARCDQVVAFQDWIPESEIARGALDDAKRAARKAALEEHVQTENWEQFAEFVRDGVDYGWPRHEFPPVHAAARLHFAYCAAVMGDTAGIDFLVDQLARDERSAAARTLLLRVGEAAVPALERATRDPDNLSSNGAAEALRALRTVQQVQVVERDYPDRVSAKSVHSPDGEDPARFLMRLGWDDDHQAIAAIRAAMNTPERLRRHIEGVKIDESPSVVEREIEVNGRHLLFVTVARPPQPTSNDVPPPPATNALGEPDAPPPASAELEPAGDGSFRTLAWAWTNLSWVPLTIDGSAALEGRDQVVLAITGHSDAGGADEVVFSVYRGLRERAQWVRRSYGYGLGSLISEQSPEIDRVVMRLRGDALTAVEP